MTITRIDASLPLPAYQTSGAVGFDLYSRVDMDIAPRSLGLVPLNIVVAVPEGYMLLVVPRSSTPKKKHLLIPHGIGVIDQDYCGSTDELLFQGYNFSDEPVQILRGERIAQGLLVKVGIADFAESKHVSSTSRGGIGSTG
ncbi:dUTP diphosphatase [Candidatus Roizmanbacteria bacterium CG10_big_fil_rev_8_21_14_0_10_45_7]|uniref:dUTP diphosphatase n=1 Tax=Candidatus Roizmanbacteria bacterium CG10_big_fil_rev_8_21_14_0_10_45_7 TaxID=1974854 RepID=A0A2M8KUR5_9BACT|nr:MAG: dUTP diphosphatase [Candidatus Roizmanbacteria bacterium CG10_big_fil_rev_8_21_14_0_10_45_7]